MRLPAILFLAAFAGAAPCLAADPDGLAEALTHGETGQVAPPWRNARAALATIRHQHWRRPDEAALVAAALDGAAAVARARPQAPQSELADAAIDAMLAELDPTARYLPADDVSRLRGEPVVAASLGIEATTRPGARPLVVAPVAGGPAAAAGVRPGDAILAIDGEDPAGLTPAALALRLQGPPGREMRLRLGRDGGETTVTVPLRPVAAPKPELIHIDGAAVLRLPVFGPATHARVLELLDRPPAAGLVLDLRGNAVGPPEQAIAIADLLLARGTIATVRGRAQPPRRMVAHKAERWAGVPMAALVDRGTAGAAEVLAAALRGNGRAVLVGEPTFGRALEHEMLPLPQGGGLLLSTAEFLGPGGEPITGRGLAPDIAVAGADAQLAAALRATAPAGSRPAR